MLRLMNNVIRHIVWSGAPAKENYWQRRSKFGNVNFKNPEHEALESKFLVILTSAVTCSH
jgi:hypothetical protein